MRLAPAAYRAAPSLQAVVEDESRTARVSAQLLKARLKRDLASKLMQFTRGFTRWDQDGDGTINRTEFRHALRQMGLAADDLVYDLVFEDFDIDQTGEISYTECLRYTLLDLLRSSATRVYSLFRLADAASTGSVNKEGFRDCIEALGISAPHASVDALFAELDEFHTGVLQYEELNKTLRRPRGHMMRQIMDTTSPRPSPAVNAIGTIRRTAMVLTLAHTVTSPTTQPPFATALARPTRMRPPPKLVAASSSRPPSPSSSSSSDLDLHDAEALVSYIRSSRIQRVLSEDDANRDATKARLSADARRAEARHMRLRAHIESHVQQCTSRHTFTRPCTAVAFRTVQATNAQGHVCRHRPMHGKSTTTTTSWTPGACNAQTRQARPRSAQVVAPTGKHWPGYERAIGAAGPDTSIKSVRPWSAPSPRTQRIARARANQGANTVPAGEK